MELVEKEKNYLNSIKNTYPKHYQLYNKELYFSNMLLTDLGLKDKVFKLIFFIPNSKKILN
jgi:hypothetical protein